MATKFVQNQVFTSSSQEKQKSVNKVPVQLDKNYLAKKKKKCIFNNNHHRKEKEEIYF